MATIEAAIAARMLAVAELTALIGSGTAARLYPLVVPQDVQMPAVAYQKISSPKENSHGGFSHLAGSRFQFTCEASTYDSAKAVAAAVRHCWNGYSGIYAPNTLESIRIDGALVQDDRDTWSETHLSPVVRIDVIIWHSEQ